MKKIIFILSLFFSVQVFSQSQDLLEKFTLEGLALGNPRAESPAPRQCPAPMNFGWWQAFERGWLYHTPATGMVLVKPQIFAKWASLNWEQGALGFPLSNEALSVNARSESVGEQFFQGGTVRHNYYTNTTTVENNPGMLATGRYRLILTGLKVESETQDDPLQRDGKGDEILIKTNGFLRDENGNTTWIAPHATKLMGDKYGYEQRDRVRAGSRGDEGGFKTGDMFPLASPWNYTTQPVVNGSYTSYLPMLVWEGDITNGNYLVVIPSVWEWDEVRASWFENNWGSMIAGMMSYLPQDYKRFQVGLGQQITHDKITGTVPVGLSEYWLSGKTFVVVNTPKIIASRQGFYFGVGNYYNISGRNQNISLHGAGSFEAVFQSTISPHGSYRLFFRWEKI